LPLQGEIQLSNSAIAIASLQILRSQGWKITEKALASGMAKTTWQGRLQWTTFTWVMGILSTKDHADIFNALLRPADRLYLMPVPDHSSADPEALKAIAQDICPNLADCCTYPNLETGLQAAISNSSEVSENLMVLCGSLYLVGHCLSLESAE
jgi:dihydrofolate synthase/folylpolyglutamate synthase